MKKFFITLYIFLLTLLGFSQVNTQDSLALIALYNSTAGANWTNPWDITQPVYWWTGVTVENNRVTKLHLPNLGLNGTISPDIGILDSLNLLRLSENNLQGNIPLEICSLTKLTEIDLSFNQLSGNIPSEIGNLFNLVKLYLNNNSLSGIIPPSIGNLNDLTTLYLNTNNLFGIIPPELGNSINLIHLYLYRNNLTGNIPTELVNLNNLRVLSLSFNSLSGQIPNELYSINSLMIIDLSNNYFSGSIQNDINSLINLDGLYISENSFEDIPDFTSLCVNHSLNNLKCDNNKLYFDDLLPNIGNSWQQFIYSPQDSVLYPIDTLVNIDSTVIFSAQIGGTQNHYQWYKNSNLLLGDTLPQLSFNQVVLADSGVYTCKIFNLQVPGLTLDRHLINLHVKDTINSVSNNNFSDKYTVIPNPFSNKISISPADFTKLEILNSNGTLLYSTKHTLQNNLEVYILELNPGIYFLNIYSEKSVFTKKIIKY